jgi:hypothetical protein
MVNKNQFTKANKQRKEVLAQREGLTVEFLKNYFKTKNEYPFEDAKQKVDNYLQKVDDYLQKSNKKTKVKDIPTIHIVNIVDRSGSMDDGFTKGDSDSKIFAANEMVKSDIEKVLNTKDVNYTYTLRTFHTVVDNYTYRLSKTPKFKKIVTDNMTALYDAVGMTLNDLKDIPENEKIIVSIITDGKNNHSIVYSANDVSKLIEELNSKNFTITFVGTTQDVEESIQNLKIDRSNTQSYDGTGAGLKMSMTVRTEALNTYTKNVIEKKDVSTGFYKKVLNK